MGLYIQKNLTYSIVAKISGTIFVLSVIFIPILEILYLIQMKSEKNYFNKIKQKENEYKEKYDIFKIIYLKENQGLGDALRIGLKYCTYNIVARMDSDDISVPNRFEKQVQEFEKDKGDTGASGMDGANGVDGKDGITPMLKVGDNNLWHVSYDNGNVWTSLIRVMPITFATMVGPRAMPHATSLRPMCWA